MSSNNEAPLPATPKKASRRNKIILSIAAVLIAVCLLCGLGIFSFVRSLQAAKDNLDTALVDLSLNPATRFKGQARGSDGTVYTIDAIVTSNGSILGTLTSNTSTIKVFVLEGQTFIRADAAFWRQRNVDEASLPDYSTQWVKVAPNVLGFDLLGLLDPVLLAERLSPGLLIDLYDNPKRDAPLLGQRLTLNGIPVQELITPRMRIYVTQAEPRRIVRIKNSQRQANGFNFAQVALAASAQGDDEFELDLSVPTDTEVDAAVSELKQEATKLATPIDSHVSFTLSGDTTFTPPNCGLKSCTATVNLQNTVTSTGSNDLTDEPVNLDVTIDMTANGQPAGSCQDSRQVEPNSITHISCEATYPTRNPSDAVLIVAKAKALARIIIATDRLINDLKQDIEYSRRIRNNAGQPNNYPCREPELESSDNGPGKWVLKTRNGGRSATYEEQISGVRRGYEYQIEHANLENPVHFDGFVIENGTYIFYEAKGPRYAYLFTRNFGEGVFNKSILEEITRQLTAISDLPNARIRWTFAEPGARKLVEELMRGGLLSNDELARIEWVDELPDKNFTRCP